MVELLLIENGPYLRYMVSQLGFSSSAIADSSMKY
jgi:hypothetical protein